MIVYRSDKMSLYTHSDDLHYFFLPVHAGYENDCLIVLIKCSSLPIESFTLFFLAQNMIGYIVLIMLKTSKMQLLDLYYIYRSVYIVHVLLLHIYTVLIKMPLIDIDFIFPVCPCWLEKCPSVPYSHLYYFFLSRKF